MDFASALAVFFLQQHTHICTVMITFSQDVAQNGWSRKYDIRINDQAGQSSETSSTVLFWSKTSKAENNFSVKHSEEHSVTEMKN